MRVAGRRTGASRGASLALIVVVALLGSLTFAPQASAADYPHPPTRTERSLAVEFLDRVNQEREARGIDPLLASPEDSDAWGFYRAQYTHDHCSSSCHDRPTDESEYEAMQPDGWSWFGEVSFGHVPAAQMTIGDALISFMHSSGHRDILLATGDDIALAVGVVCDRGEMTVVANVLARDGVQASVPETSPDPVATQPGSGESCGWRRHWIASSDGAVVTHGGAAQHGSMAGARLNAPIIGIAATPDRGGYWLLASDGGIFSFGNARFHGSTGGMHLNAPIIAMATTSTGNGYWLLGADGGIFTFGDAAFFGSTGGMALNQPVVGMSPTLDGDGYWLVAADGGVFSFGRAPFVGSAVGHANAPIVDMVPSPLGGYWLLAWDGQVLGFGGAPVLGHGGSRAIDLAPVPEDVGYFIITVDGIVDGFGAALVRSEDRYVQTEGWVIGSAA